MEAGGYFTLAMLIVLLLPIVVMPLEGRRSPDVLYAVIAACGLAVSTWNGGQAGLGRAVLASLLVFVAVGGIITLLRSKLRLRILSGGQIKLMAAGAAWLGPSGALIMLVSSILALFSVAMWRRLSEARSRPVSMTVVAFAIMIAALQQNISLF